jgi:hypothetical protein
MITFAMCCYAGGQYEDLIDITQSSGKIFAFVGSQRSASFDLKASERVQWSDSKGILGCFLTNFRFFVISDTANAWQVYPLRLNEAEDSVASLSATVALLVTDERAIGFDGKVKFFLDP